MCPRKSGEHNPKVNPQKDSLWGKERKNCALMYSKKWIFCGTDVKVYNKWLKGLERKQRCVGAGSDCSRGAGARLIRVRHTGNTRMKSMFKVSGVGRAMEGIS